MKQIFECKMVGESTTKRGASRKWDLYVNSENILKAVQEASIIARYRWPGYYWWCSDVKPVQFTQLTMFDNDTANRKESA